MHSRRRLAAVVAATVVAGLLGAGDALAQPTLSTPGGGTGNADMDHSRMGGGAQSQGQSSTRPAPTLNTPGGGTGNADMDHSRMGGGGQGAGSPAGGRITGNSGEGGPEVRHGHGPAPAPAPTPRR